jgi:pyrroloquinoline-quinone synthase
MVTISPTDRLTETLKQEVETHKVLQMPWLQKRKDFLEKSDLLLWLSQEYFVSVDFVNWFLLSAVQTNSIDAKIILVHNIWEELGEGNAFDSHVKILEKFLEDMGFDFSSHKILKGTEDYLKRMKEIISMGFLESLGALGPANEYLLKLEYGMMSESYKKLKERETLPEARFFQVNLEADESHSAKMFRLIEKMAQSESEKKAVVLGNKLALDARILFYEGLPV